MEREKENAPIQSKAHLGHQQMRTLPLRRCPMNRRNLSVRQGFLLFDGSNLEMISVSDLGRGNVRDELEACEEAGTG